MPLFSMTLTPEGNPVWDKVGKMAKLYARYRDALEKDGVKCGILVQASLGHGYVITPNPFQCYIGMTDGKEYFSCCPEDENFIKHFCDVLKTLAKERPAVIMLDDDFRLMHRPGRGCGCPLHMEEFNRRTGLNMTREELAAHIASHDENDELTDVFRDTQRDSLIKAAKAFRAAVDSVDPTIQGINCTSGHTCESVIYTNKIWPGEGNPMMVRVPNGIYAPITVRGFSDLMRNAAICGSKLRKHDIDIILAETDTVPFNRYAKGARYLHAHYTASILEGLKGTKHWLTRSAAFEPESGKAYREILAKNYGLYEKLSQLSDEIQWVGINGVFLEQEKVLFKTTSVWRYHTCEWIAKNIERMGLPFYFAEENHGIAIIEDGIIPDMTDSQIASLFQGSVIMDGQSAEDLIQRGYGDLLGVDVKPWEKGNVSGESFDGTINCTCTKQKNLKEIQIINDGVKAISYNYCSKDDQADILAPAVTVYKRENGKLSIVFCGSPDAEFTYGEGFAFLNETRKKQFIELMKEANALPVYCYGDDEVCLRAGYLKDGTLMTVIYELGIDPMKNVLLYLKEKPQNIELMQSDGTTSKVTWEDIGDNLYRIHTRVETLLGFYRQSLVGLPTNCFLKKYTV